MEIFVPLAEKMLETNVIYIEKICYIQTIFYHNQTHENHTLKQILWSGRQLIRGIFTAG
jgi:hypothetical protein